MSTGLGNVIVPGSSEESGRIIYELMFFMVVLVMLLNIIFGIIIDTFSNLRVQDGVRRDVFTNTCFVCSIQRAVFDGAASKRGIQNGYIVHRKFEHNIWHYLFFIVYLKNKDHTEYSGVEQHVAKCISEDDISWLPSQLALVLQEADDDDGEGADGVQGESEVEVARKTRGEVADMKAQLDELPALLAEQFKQLTRKMEMGGRGPARRTARTGGGGVGGGGGSRGGLRPPSAAGQQVSSFGGGGGGGSGGSGVVSPSLDSESGGFSQRDE